MVSQFSIIHTTVFRVIVPIVDSIEDTENGVKRNVAQCESNRMTIELSHFS